MKNIIKFIFVLFFSLFVGRGGFAQLSVDGTAPYNTPAYFVQNVLMGAGITATNITYLGDPGQIGFFNGINSDLGLDSGLVLSSDDIQDNIPLGVTAGINGIGIDDDLLTIANSVPSLIGQSFSVSSINDKCILEFDFIPSCDTLLFQYVFGSDEYLTYVNSPYNDVFAFLISGPGITGPYQSPPGFPGGAKNIAIVPNSAPPLPITISSVNNMLNSQYYIDNPSNTSVGLNGFTSIFTAVAVVTPNETHHIKLAIADGSDGALISSVFLKAGSFKSTGDFSPLVLNVSSENVDCFGNCNGTAMVTVSGGNPPYNFHWSDGQNYSTALGLCAGIYYVAVSDTMSSCPSIVEVVITEPQDLFLALSSNADSGNAGGTATVFVTGGTAPYSALWSDSGSQSTFTATGLSSGTYMVTITDSAGCSSVDSIDVSFYSGRKEMPAEEYSPSIFPNPNDGKFHVSCSNCRYSVQGLSVFDILGEEIFRLPDSDSEEREYRWPVSINLSDHPKGIYFLRISFFYGNGDYIKFVKCE